MPYPPPKDKSPGDAKQARALLATRINRAANDLNPILMVFAVGLLILNLTLYLGLAASREPGLWAPPHQADPRPAPGMTMSLPPAEAAPASAAGN